MINLKLVDFCFPCSAFLIIAKYVQFYQVKCDLEFYGNSLWLEDHIKSCKMQPRNVHNWLCQYLIDLFRLLVKDSQILVQWLWVSCDNVMEFQVEFKVWFLFWIYYGKIHTGCQNINIRAIFKCDINAWGSWHQWKSHQIEH